jgi:hypothetical protein
MILSVMFMPQTQNSGQALASERAARYSMYSALVSALTAGAAAAAYIISRLQL